MRTSTWSVYGDRHGKDHLNRNAYAPQFEPSVSQSNISKTNRSEAVEYVHVNSLISASFTYDPSSQVNQPSDF